MTTGFPEVIPGMIDFVLSELAVAGEAGAGDNGSVSCFSRSSKNSPKDRKSFGGRLIPLIGLAPFRLFSKCTREWYK